jgi:hypothetical protein
MVNYEMPDNRRRLSPKGASQKKIPNVYHEWAPSLFKAVFTRSSKFAMATHIQVSAAP